MKSVIKNVLREPRIVGLCFLLAGPFALTPQSGLAQSELISPLASPLLELETDDGSSIRSAVFAYQVGSSVSGRFPGVSVSIYYDSRCPDSDQVLKRIDEFTRTFPGTPVHGYQVNNDPSAVRLSKARWGIVSRELSVDQQISAKLFGIDTVPTVVIDNALTGIQLRYNGPLSPGDLVTGIKKTAIQPRRGFSVSADVQRRALVEKRLNQAEQERVLNSLNQKY